MDRTDRAGRADPHPWGTEYHNGALARLTAAPAEPKPVSGPRTDPVAERQEAAVRAADQNARGTATTLLVATLGGLALAGIVFAGRHRRWAATRR